MEKNRKGYRDCWLAKRLVTELGEEKKEQPGVMSPVTCDFKDLTDMSYVKRNRGTRLYHGGDTKII